MTKLSLLDKDLPHEPIKGKGKVNMIEADERLVNAILKLSSKQREQFKENEEKEK